MSKVGCRGRLASRQRKPMAHRPAVRYGLPSKESMLQAVRTEYTMSWTLWKISGESSSAAVGQRLLADTNCEKSVSQCGTIDHGVS